MIDALPHDVRDFGKIRETGCAYADKSLSIWELSRECGFVLCRPLGMGKSVILSGLRDYFLGKRDLFKGLTLERLEKDWKQYKVIYIDLGEVQSLNKSVDEVLSDQLARVQEYLGQEYEGTSLQVLTQMIEDNSDGVILVDDVDCLQGAQDYKQFIYAIEKSRMRFKGFTSTAPIEIDDDSTLKDISLMPEYWDVCGFTETELVQVFETSIMEMAVASGVSFGEMSDTLGDVYAGYRFTTDLTKEILFNPLSIVEALSKQSLKSHWFGIGQHSVLKELVEHACYDFAELLGGITLRPTEKEYEHLRYPISNLYYAGYLTISGNSSANHVALDFPSQDIKMAAINWVIQNSPGDHPVIDLDRLLVALLSAV